MILYIFVVSLFLSLTPSKAQIVKYRVCDAAAVHKIKYNNQVLPVLLHTYFASEMAEKMYCVSWQLYSDVWLHFLHAVSALFLCCPVLAGIVLNL